MLLLVGLLSDSVKSIVRSSWTLLAVSDKSSITDGMSPLGSTCSCAKLINLFERKLVTFIASARVSFLIIVCGGVCVCGYGFDMPWQRV